MADYFSTLTAQQYNNIGILITRMKAKGITNRYAQAAILAVISKESNFNPRFESGYKTTSNERIRQIFSSTRNLSEDALTKLKSDDRAFFNFVYGGKFGNTDANDGHKYRGAGYNQITFKSNYLQAKQDSGVDVVTYPERLNEPQTASDAVIGYFLRRFAGAKRDINGFNRIEDAVNDFYAANAGKLGQKITSDPTGGFAKTAGRAAGFYDYILKHGNESENFLKIKDNFYRYKYLYLFIFLLIIGLIVWYVLKKK